MRWCALSSDLIFTQAVLKKIGLSFLVHARADSSTARAGNETRTKQENETHTHTFLCHSRFGISETDERVRSRN